MPINKVDFEQFIHQAQVKVVGASDAGLKGEFYDVVSEFLNDSSIWTQEVTIPYQPNTQNYPLLIPEGVILRLSGVVDWGSVVPLLPTQTIPPGTPAPIPVSALMPIHGLLTVKNIPQITGFYQAQVVTNIALPTDKHMLPQAPDWLLPIWHVGLLDGLLGKMMTSPNKSYSNATQGAYHLKRFRDAIARARVSKLKANTVGAQAWRFPQQFRSMSQQSGVPAIGSSNERSF